MTVMKPASARPLRSVEEDSFMMGTGWIDRVASLASGQAPYRPGGNVGRDCRHESIGLFAVPMYGGDVAVIPEGGIHVGLYTHGIDCFSKYCRS